MARAPIGDGQSGLRALSRAAAADAEIVHDYNYAQVLTLDLLAKGYRYLEVPIGYQFRTWPLLRPPLRYLRRVVPAVGQQLNRTTAWSRLAADDHYTPTGDRRSGRSVSPRPRGRRSLRGGPGGVVEGAAAGPRASAAAQAMARA